MTQIASFVVLIAPAVYVWWQGRRLIRRVDDPAFAELRFANAQRLVFVIAAAIATSLVISFEYPLIKLAVLLVALLVARFPARRAIFEESWGLFAYLSHTLRFWSAMLGVWVLLALQPFFAHRAGSYALPVALLILATALFWHQFNAWILPWLLGADRLERPELQVKFDDVVTKASCQYPRLLEMDARGGYWVNAFALPSRKRPAVMFTADLLKALTPAETQAIFAHEVAHLEYFDARRLIRREIAVALLAALPFSVVLGLGIDSVSLATLTWAWPLVVLGALVALAAQSQSREHDSDLRALELVGEAEPLISALTKIHHLMKLPRRWRADSEGRMSHPSLAKRLRAIRDAAAAQGLAVSEVETPGVLVVRAADDPEQVVILAKDRLHWLHGVDSGLGADPVALLNEARDARSIRYADLRDLRLNVSGAKNRQLIAVDGRGATLKLPVAPTDVERLKAAIEHLDLKVEGTTLAASKQQAQDTTRQRNARILGVLACLFAVLTPSSLPLLVIGLLLLARPARVTLAATGVVALGAGLLGSRQSNGLYFDQAPPTLLLVGEALLGLLLIYFAIRNPSEDRRERWPTIKVTLLALGALAALYLIGGLTRLESNLPAMQLHLWARYTPGFILVLLGLGTTLWISRPRLARLPALAAFILAAALLVTSTLWFRYNFSGDALAAAQKSLATPLSSPEVIREVPIKGSVAELRLSPSGRRVAAQTYNWTDADYRYEEARFQIELADGGFAEISAIDLDFLDDDRAVVLRASQNGTLRLQVIGTDTSQAVIFETALPALGQPRLRVDPDAGRWEVVEVDTYEGRAVLLAGDFEVGEHQQFEWALRDPGETYAEQAMITDAIVGTNRQTLVLTQRFPGYTFGGLIYMLVPLSGLASSSDLVLIGDSVTTRLGPTALTVWCLDSRAAQAEFVCAANDPAAGTGLWSIDPSAGRLSPIGALRGQYSQGTLSADGRLLVGGYGVDPVLLDLESGQTHGLSVQAPSTRANDDDASERSSAFDTWIETLFGGSYYAPTYHAMTLQGGLFALTFSHRDNTLVRVYRLRE